MLPGKLSYFGGAFTNSSANKYVAKYCSSLSMELTNAPAEIKLFPNPFSDNLIIGDIDFTNKNAEIKIYDIFGRVVLSQPILFSYLKLNTGDLPAGVYFVKVNNTVKKVMKQ